MDENVNVVLGWKEGISSADYRYRLNHEKPDSCKECVSEPNYDEELSGCSCKRDLTTDKKCNGSEYYKRKYGSKGGKKLN